MLGVCNGCWWIGCICNTIAWWWQTHRCWVCAMAVGGSVVYATQLRGGGRLIVVGCVQWQLRHYQAGGSIWVGRSRRSSGASSPRLRPAQRNYRDPQAGGSTGVGQVWWVAGAGCICDAIAPGVSLYMRHNCVVVTDSLKCAYANPRPD